MVTAGGNGTLASRKEDRKPPFAAPRARRLKRVDPAQAVGRLRSRLEQIAEDRGRSPSEMLLSQARSAAALAG